MPFRTQSVQIDKEKAQQTMALKLDPEVESAVAPMIAAKANLPKLAVGDVNGRRAHFSSFMAAISGALPTPTDVTAKDFYTTTSDGHELLVRWIAKTPAENATAPTSALVYAHGGGERKHSPSPLPFFLNRLIVIKNRNDHGRRRRLQASFDEPGLANRRPAVGRGL